MTLSWTLTKDGHGWHDEDGTYWSDTRHGAAVGKSIGICDCGHAKECIGVLRRILVNVLKMNGYEWTLEEELILQFLDLKGIVEHGGGIRSCWLTAKGEWLLDALLFDRTE